jgi:hypothetical protein
MTLSELKPRGYRLSDVPPDFQGMPLAEWEAKIERSRVEAHFETKEWKKLRAEQKWDKRAVVTPTSRDEYGIRSM